MVFSYQSKGQIMGSIGIYIYTYRTIIMSTVHVSQLRARITHREGHATHQSQYLRVQWTYKERIAMHSQLLLNNKSSNSPFLGLRSYGYYRVGTVTKQRKEAFTNCLSRTDSKH